MISLLISSAQAHATFSPSTVNIGYASSGLRVPHGCAGNSTVEVTVTIPESVSSVKPRKGNYTVSFETRAIPPITSEGRTINTTVSSVKFSNFDLSDLLYEEFGFTFKVSGKAGDKLFFPVVQKCTVGWNNWTQITKEGEPKPRYPAPFLTLADGNAPKSSALKSLVFLPFAMLFL